MYAIRSYYAIPELRPEPLVIVEIAADVCEPPQLGRKCILGPEERDARHGRGDLTFGVTRTRSRVSGARRG